MNVPVHSPDKIYLPDVQDSSCSLGKGGCFTTVERYVEKESRGIFAVKKMSKLHTQGYGDLFYNEMCALGRAEVHNIPRVIKYVQPAKSEDDICLILELVRGRTLSKHMCSRHTYTQESWEQQVLEVAAWIHWRNYTGKHTRLFNKNKLYVGVRTKDVKPTGATTSYTAPELLRSLQRQWEGAEDDEDFVMINGPAADIWSFACVCYEMLTGDLPFLPDQTPATCAPAVVVEEEVACKAGPAMSITSRLDMVEDGLIPENEDDADEDPCLLPKPDFTPSQQHPDKDAGAHDPCRGIIGHAYYAAGAVSGICFGLRKLRS
ncbi:hypothetical protein WJX82_002653 [Trebouxia sp. C0006]